MIGFQTEDALLRAIATGFLTQPFIIFLEITLTSTSPFLPYLQPFLGPLMVFGHIVYYLALLIFAAFGGSFSYGRSNYGFAQFLMIGSRLTSLALGSYFTIPALVNVAIVYGIIYLVEKTVEMVGNSKLIYVILFALSAGLYLTAIYLSANPQFLYSLIDTTRYTFAPKA
jgi:hypothetical protein